MNNFWQRLFTGAVFTGVLVGATILSGWYLHIVAGLLTLVMVHEYCQLFRNSPYSPDRLVIPILAITIYAFFILDIQSVALRKDPALYGIVILIFLPIMLSAIELFRRKKTPIINVALGLFGILYIVTPMIFLNRLAINPRTLSVEMILPVLSLFLMMWSNDTFAYLIGKAWGKHKMAEKISPKKTWEGFAGGFIFAILCGIVIAAITKGNYFEFISYAIVISIAGTIGDLFESQLKRSVGAKDSGKLLPGHGGFLDRMDAMLFAIIPVFFLHFYVFN